MKPRAEPLAKPPAHGRFDIDRVWLARIALVIALAGGFVLFAHVSTRMLDTGTKRIERVEQQEGDAAPRARPAGGGP